MNSREGSLPSGPRPDPEAQEDRRPGRLSRREALTLGGAGVFGFLGVASAADLAAGDPVGRDVIADLNHRVITTIETHAGVSPDEHEFLITPRGTALITSYVQTPFDLCRHGGSSEGSVMNGVFEEIDIATGKVLQHWESLDHDGNIIISARHTWTSYKIERMTGRVLWRLGGKRVTSRCPRPPGSPGSTTCSSRHRRCSGCSTTPVTGPRSSIPGAGSCGSRSTSPAAGSP